MYALRIVNTAATSPRPSPTVVTIVRATRGARRNKRHVKRMSRARLLRWTCSSLRQSDLPTVTEETKATDEKFILWLEDKITS